MEKELVKFENNKDFLKDSPINTDKSLLNKKRKPPKERTNITDLDNDEDLEEDLKNIFANVKSFNNINFDKLVNLPTNQNQVEEKTKISGGELGLKLTIELDEENEENKNFEYTSLIKNDTQKKENNPNIIINNATNKIDDSSQQIVKIDKDIHSKSQEKTFKTKIKLKNSLDLNCFALDLLKENGEFQIKFSNISNNAYILKIKEVEIKDDYYEQVEYAKNHCKNFYLKNTAPNNKFWNQRYYYFSKFDKGIKMDEDSWYSVTPENIAKYTAKLIKGKTIIDGFCGCGGNVIQFSKYCSKVYAIDISKSKLDLCKNNCEVYNCKNNIEFIHSDFLQMKNKIKADYIFLSPPWGGTEYKNDDVYSIKKLMRPDITEIIRVSLNVADNILFFLPRSLNLDELFDLCSAVREEIKEGSGKNIFFDIQIIESNGRIKALLIILGHHIKDYFSRHKLEKFVNKYYDNVDEKNINDLYSEIKKIGLYKFFREEYIFRTTKMKDLKRKQFYYLNEYIKNLSNQN